MYDILSQVVVGVVGFLRGRVSGMQGRRQALAQCQAGSCEELRLHRAFSLRDTDRPDRTRGPWTCMHFRTSSY